MLFFDSYFKQKLYAFAHYLKTIQEKQSNVTSVSRHHGAQLRAPWFSEILRTSEHYRIKGFKKALNWAPMPRDLSFSGQLMEVFFSHPRVGVGHRLWGPDAMTPWRDVYILYSSDIYLYIYMH